jgi:phosphomannomutase
MEKIKLRQKYYNSVKKNTPRNIQENAIFNLKNNNELELILTRELIKKWGVEEWLKNYKKEAEYSTGGIRGTQNILYPWDSRFPINQLGVALATLGKALVLKKRIKNRQINKIAAGEVRYNTKSYVELISRIQSALGIKTHLPFKRDTIPVWMVSFLIFMLDYEGGEYVTASHSVSSKIATKDLDDEGSQFLARDSLEFINNIEKIVKEAKEKKYKIKLSKKYNPLISEDFNGYNLYIKYLKNGVATKSNLDLIKKANKKGIRIMIDTVGGCMYKSLVPILKKLSIDKVFDWVHIEEDPFFHGIGKILRKNPDTGKKEFFDLSCDLCLFDVFKTAGYEKILKSKPVGYFVLITDPDGDRLVLAQVESVKNKKRLDDFGINYIRIDNKKICALYHPTYFFLPLMDFHKEQLENAGLWKKYNWFLLTTTPSSKAWEEWACANNIPVVLTPVGFKEIALVIRKINKQIKENPGKNVSVEDIYGQKINLGKKPRLFWTGEESGGMITGPRELIKSKKGRITISMMEKSAGEASIISAALIADLYLKNKSFLTYLEEVVKNNHIIYKYFFAEDLIYYNESEPNPEILKQSKLKGEVLRDRADQYYLGLVLGVREKKINIDDARKILSEAFPSLNFEKLENAFFVGDGAYFKFHNIFLEMRRSGTDAKLKGYCGGEDKNKCRQYLDEFLHYEGRITPLYNKLISADFRKKIYPLIKRLYEEYSLKGL